MGEDPVAAEMEQEPSPTDVFIKVKNVKRTDGKNVSYISEGVDTILFPWHRITFLEFMSDDSDAENIIGFFR